MTKSGISFWHPASLICTVFGVGKIPFAPGTWGSLVGVLLFAQIWFYSLFILPFLFLIGWAAAVYYGKVTDKEDASEIVIDEVVGQLITIIIAIGAALYFQLNPYLSEICPACFVLKYVICLTTFRFFDIAKPGPVGWIDRNVKGGWGVMLDDVVAGVFAGLTSVLIFYAITLI